MAMVCDAGYFPYAVYLALQIHNSHSARQFDVVVVCSDEAARPRTLPVKDLRIVRMTGANPFRHLPENARRTHATYLCLMLPDLLPEYERIAYLDCDIAVAIPDLDKLLRLNLRDRAVGAVRDIAQWRTPTRRPKEMIRLNRSTHPYFNSGVMLIDSGRWRAERLGESCVSITRDETLRKALLREDQSIINFATGGRWCEISPVWNWQWTWASRMFADAAGARLVHFIGPKKPWNSCEVPLHYTYGYRSFLHRHFPSHTRSDGELPPNIRNLGRVLVRHRIRMSATQALLDRFPSITTTYAH